MKENSFTHMLTSIKRHNSSNATQLAWLSTVDPNSFIGPQVTATFAKLVRPTSSNVRGRTSIAGKRYICPSALSRSCLKSWSAFITVWFINLDFWLTISTGSSIPSLLVRLFMYSTIESCTISCVDTVLDTNKQQNLPRLKPRENSKKSQPSISLVS